MGEAAEDEVMAGRTTEHLAEQFEKLRHKQDTLVNDVHGIRLDLGTFKAKIDTILGISKAVGTLFAVYAVSSLAAGIWWASSLSSDVRHLTKAVEEGQKIQREQAAPKPPTAAAPAPPFEVSGSAVGKS